MNKRMLRVENDFKFALMQTFLRLDIGYVTITRLRFSTDLRNVKVEVSHMFKEKFSRELNDNLFLICKELKNHFSAKFFPRILFVEDSHIERIERIREIFKECEAELA